MSIPYHGSLGSSHAGPAFQWNVVLVDHGLHHAANIEGFLSSGVGFVREYLTHSIERGFKNVGVRIRLDVPVTGVVGSGPTGKSLAAHNVGVLVVLQQDMAGLTNVPCPV